MLLIHIKVK